MYASVECKMQSTESYKTEVSEQPKAKPNKLKRLLVLGGLGLVSFLGVKYLGPQIVEKLYPLTQQVTPL